VNEIQKQKQQIDTNLKLLTSAAIAGSGLLAGGLTSFAKSSNGMNNNQTFSKENRTSVKNLYVIMPDANTNKKYIKNPNYKQFVTDYGCQIVPFKFYNKDAQLTEYEKFFNDNKSACVPMALAMDYFRKIQNDDE
jgi:ABC-type transporter Mla subunit MlaD